MGITVPYKIIWDILKCCGIDCCAGNAGAGGDAVVDIMIDEINNAIVFKEQTVILFQLVH